MNLTPKSFSRSPHMSAHSQRSVCLALPTRGGGGGGINTQGRYILLRAPAMSSRPGWPAPYWAGLSREGQSAILWPCSLQWKHRPPVPLAPTSVLDRWGYNLFCPGLPFIRWKLNFFCPSSSCRGRWAGLLSSALWSGRLLCLCTSCQLEGPAAPPAPPFRFLFYWKGCLPFFLSSIGVESQVVLSLSFWLCIIV